MLTAQIRIIRMQLFINNPSISNETRKIFRCCSRHIQYQTTSPSSFSGVCRGHFRASFVRGKQRIRRLSFRYVSDVVCSEFGTVTFSDTRLLTVMKIYKWGIELLYRVYRSVGRYRSREYVALSLRIMDANSSRRTFAREIKVSKRNMRIEIVRIFTSFL